jgi:type IV pilus assembly protein PilE
MIALAIAAVIAAFAFPVYRSQIARSHRADAVAAVYRAAQFVEMQRQMPDAAGATNAGVTALPAGMDQAPQSGVVVYTLRILPADDTNGGYAIEASPAATGPMGGDACGTFILDATGHHSSLPGNDAAAPDVDECWGRR